MVIFYRASMSRAQRCEKKLSEMNITIDRLIAAAQDENLKAAIEKAFDKQSELIALCERDTYLAGFKLASRLITAILAD